jgi:hypothetical protein
MIPGFTQYGLAEHILIDGERYSYSYWRDRWMSQWSSVWDSESGFSAYELHVMICDGLYRFEVAA